MIEIYAKDCLVNYVITGDRELPLSSPKVPERIQAYIHKRRAEMMTDLGLRHHHSYIGKRGHAVAAKRAGGAIEFSQLGHAARKEDV